MQVLLVPRFRRHLAAGLAAIGALFATALVLGAARAESPEEAMGKSTGPLVLVTRAEIDALPDEVPVVWGRNWDSPDGPVIAIDSPQNGATYEGPFPITVEFREGPKGHAVDMTTLELEYKMAFGIDITDRVRDYVEGNRIDVDESELPTGRHTVEIRIEDTEGNGSSEQFTVTVK